MKKSNDLHTSDGKGFTLIELLVVVAIIALLISILLPSLSAAKAMAKSVLCASRQKVAYTGLVNYASDFKGKYMAIWDRGPYPWTTNRAISNQAPYTYWYYFQGESLPGAAYHGGKGGWWNHLAGARGGWSPITSPQDSRHCPAYHCSELEDKMGSGYYITQFQPHLLSYTLFVPRLYDKATKTWQYDYSWYATADLYTHPGSTGVLMCLAGSSEDSEQSYQGYNAWTDYEISSLADPHGGQSNYLFADGHVEKRSASASDEFMWSPMLKPE